MDLTNGFGGELAQDGFFYVRLAEAVLVPNHEEDRVEETQQ